ncbi:unnamed protein product, partial [Ectocarpus sp. 12 AP-2014]
MHIVSSSRKSKLPAYRPAPCGTSLRTRLIEATANMLWTVWLSPLFLLVQGIGAGAEGSVPDMALDASYPGEVDHPISDVMLRESMTFDEYFNQPMDEILWPESLKEMRFGKID